MLCCCGESPLPRFSVGYEVLVLFNLIVAGVGKVREIFLVNPSYWRRS